MIIQLNERELCDLELILNGAFYPLKTFMNSKDYNSVITNYRLTDNTIFPLPITLSIPEKTQVNIGDKIKLCDSTNYPIAYMTVEEVYEPDYEKEFIGSLGTSDNNHPYIAWKMSLGGVKYVSGELEKINMPLHYDFSEIRLTPQETKEYFKKNNWDVIIGFQTRNPMHRSHYELTKYALKEAGDNAKLLLHPVVGVTQEVDVDYFTRVKCYKELIKNYDENSVLLSLLPLSMRMAGPKEALLHAIIRKNYGCTHFIVGRDHAGPSYKTKDGRNFYEPYEAQEFVSKYADEVGIKIILSTEIAYDGTDKVYKKITEIPKNHEVWNISGTKQREMLKNGIEIPEWYTFNNIAKILETSYKNSGMCIYLVGLSGSGKSTIANLLKQRIIEKELKPVTILDADVIRTHLSKGLGFSREDRSMNVRRIGYVASEIVKHNGIVIVANIAPYEEDRQYNRRLISSYGKYIEVYVKTSLEVCENRDVKGLYKLAREGKIQNFTGINDPFEEPQTSDIIIDGSDEIYSCLDKIIDVIKN